MTLRGADVVVIGAGIIGLSCAWELTRRGAHCVLVDPRGPAGAASFGNAGSISVGNVMPQATPGIALKGLRMLLDRRAPLKLDWQRLPGYWRWLLQFVAAADGARLPAIMDALHAINHASRDAWLQLATQIDARSLLRESGYLHVYSEERSLLGAAAEREAMRTRGVQFHALDRRGVQALEPALGERFHYGTFQPQAMALTDPGGFCQRLHALLVQGGALSLADEVLALRPAGTHCTVETRAGRLRAQHVVLAAGAWSARLLAPLGITLPLVPARGYHLMYPGNGGLLQRPTLWAERYMVIAPMTHGLRMTSIKELTGVDSTPRFAHIRRRDADARVLLPQLAGPPASEWAGLRPCTPDSLPVIDSVHQRLHLATGHGHLGMTQGPLTGVLLAQQLAGEPTSIPLAPYALRRFGAAAAVPAAAR